MKSTGSLTQNEQKVISAVRFNSRATAVEVSKATGLREHSVRRALDNLIERGVLSPYLIVDIGCLGLADYGVFLSRSAEAATKRDRFLRRLEKSESVPWVGEFAGEYQYGFSILVPHPRQADEFLLNLGEHLRPTIARTVSARTHWWIFGERYLSGNGRTKSYEYGGTNGVVQLDELDLSLLRLLSRPEVLSSSQLSRATDQPPSTVQYRIRNLEKRGVIIAYAYKVDPAKIGMLPYLLLLCCPAQTPEFRRQLIAFALANSSVVSITSCVGDWSYELEVHVAAPSQLGEFQSALVERFERDIFAVKTLNVLGTRKLQPLPGGDLPLSLSSSLSRVHSVRTTERAIRIGVLMPLTGEFPVHIRSFREGMLLGIDDINRDLAPNGFKFELFIEDSGSQRKTVLAAAQKLIRMGICAAITTVYPETVVGGAEFQRNKIPTLALWDSSPEIDSMGEYFFAIGPWVPSAAEKSATFARKRLKAATAVIVNNTERWSSHVGDLFVSAFERLGGEVVARYQLTVGDSDFHSVLTKLKKARPDVLYAPLASQVIPFLQQRHSIGVVIPCISSDVISSEDARRWPEPLEGIYQTAIRDPENCMAQSLYERYEQRYKQKPEMPWFVATGYDAVRLYALAISRSGPTGENIKDDLYSIQDFEGAQQRICISDGGSSPYYENMFQVRDGKFILVE